MVDGGIIKISPSFVIEDMLHAFSIINELDKLFNSISILTEKGFINNPKVNLPIVVNLIKNLDIEKSSKGFDISITLNTLYYNLILLIMYRIVIYVNSWIRDNCKKFDCSDQLVDLRNVRNNIIRMMHPTIKKRVKNKGIYVTLNSITGYDSEYEEKSSLEMTNSLLSIQLASSSYMNIKVPVIAQGPIKPSDLGVTNSKS